MLCTLFQSAKHLSYTRDNSQPHLTPGRECLVRTSHPLFKKNPCNSEFPLIRFPYNCVRYFIPSKDFVIMLPFLDQLLSFVQGTNNSILLSTVFVVIALGLWSIQTHKPRDPREPPVFASTIPVVGHLLNLIIYQAEYIKLLAFVNLDIPRLYEMLKYLLDQKQHGPSSLSKSFLGRFMSSLLPSSCKPSSRIPNHSRSMRSPSRLQRRYSGSPRDRWIYYRGQKRAAQTNTR